ncbi:MAG: gamma-glutamylcyclotransferase [Candidatus Hydrogenedentes bacterium]|nr:gamma-glutamylcyclotransferase [Candidatus Hydrogenedentota bacterium]
MNFPGLPTMPDTHLLFAYGSLLNPLVQRSVIGREIKGTPDRLFGFKKTTLRDGDEQYPNLSQDPQANVEGQVLEISDAELGRIDLYEGDLYVRRRVTLASGTQTWVYFS